VTAVGEALVQADALFRRRWLSRRFGNTAVLGTGLLLVGAVVLLSAIAPLIGFGHPNRVDVLHTFSPPSWKAPFGTDDVGRNVFSRVLYGTRTDLVVALVTTYVPMVIGILVGGVAGYFSGRTDTILMRLVDVVMAFPFLVLVLGLIAVFGQGLTGVYVGLIAVGWTLYARITRAEMLVVREQQYVLAAQTLGFSHWRVLFRHALPNTLRPNVVFSMADVVLNILFLSSLSYLGLGVVPPTPEWGAIVAGGQPYLLTAWWISTLSGLAIVVVGIGFSLIGDGLADRLGVESMETP
jgi:peptide/nickel transport system permease protein